MWTPRCAVTAPTRPLRRGALLLECLIALLLTTATAGLLVLLADTMRTLRDERQQLLLIRDAQGAAYIPLRASPCTPPIPLTVALAPRLVLETRPLQTGPAMLVSARWWHADARSAAASSLHTLQTSAVAWCER